METSIEMPMDNFDPAIEDMQTACNIEVPPETLRPCRIVPDQTSKTLYSAWSDALTQLVTPLLEYITRSTGKVLSRVVSLKSKCRSAGGCISKASQVLCLFQDCKLFASLSGLLS